MYKLKLLFLKTVIKILDMCGRGSSLPGVIDQKFKLNLLKDLNFEEYDITFVMGTNGKTTTANLLSDMIASKYEVINNSAGANMQSGIKTELLKNLTMKKSLNATKIVFEVDEKSLKYVVKFCKPNRVIITNFFRDQLDRYGEIDTMIKEIVDIIDDLDCELLLNANDPLVYDYFGNLSNSKIYYEVEDHIYTSKTQDKIVEIKYCPICCSKLKYDFYHYGHIGKFECSNNACNFKSPKADYSLRLDYEKKQFYVNQDEYRMLENAPVYFYFNVMQALVLASKADVAVNDCQKIINEFKFPKGRSQTIKKNDVQLYFNLAKNVVGFEETFEFLNKSDTQKFDLLICFNDNYADGLDVSWIWDANVSVLFDKINSVHIIGTRRYDMALRFEMEGFTDVVVIDDFQKGAVDFLNSDAIKNKVVISNYTPLVEIDKIITRWVNE